MATHQMAGTPSLVFDRNKNAYVLHEIDLEKGKDNAYTSTTTRSIDNADAASIREGESLPVSEKRKSRFGAVLNNVTSKSEKRQSVAPSPPPDGGFQAWMMVACGHMVLIVTWGFISSYGLFQTHYLETLHVSPSAASWIGSATIGLTYFVGTIAGRLTDMGYFYTVFRIGSALLLIGIFATPLCKTYWQVFLAHGVCIGIGDGLMFTPTLTLMSQYWAKRRSLAIGIVATGGATGGMIIPGMVRQLLPQIGFPWTVRCVGFLMLFGVVFCNAFMKPRITGRKTGPFVDWAAFKEIEYSLYAVGSFFCMQGLYYAFWYLVSFGKYGLDPGLSYVNSLNLVLVLNAVGLVGRLASNSIADKVGIVNLLIPSVFFSGLAVMFWPLVHNVPGFYSWTVFYGFPAAAVQSLFPAACSALTDDIRKVGVRLGMIFTIVSVATLIGPPIQGAIIGMQGGKYWGSQLYTGSCLIIGSGFFAASRYYRSKKRGKGWRDKV